MDGRTIHERQRYLFVKRCLACGYDGVMTRAMDDSHCPQCGCDFTQRPARSYAELEGLMGHSLPILNETAAEFADHWAHKTAPEDSTSAQTIERWLLFIFVTFVLIFAVGALTAAMLKG